MKPSIKEAIVSVLEACGEVSNYDLEQLVPKITNCLSGTVGRERRELGGMIKSRREYNNGVATNTYFYSLAQG